jgi:hypothetical protein
METDAASKKAPEPFIDRRRHPRYRLSVPLTIRAADGVIMRGISIEISASGLSAIIAQSLKLNDTVEIEPIAAVRVLALVKHNIGKIYGFEFLNLTTEQTQRITDSCKMLPLYKGKSLGI